jgi:hypothetical protein
MSPSSARSSAAYAIDNTGSLTKLNLYEHKAIMAI